MEDIEGGMAAPSKSAVGPIWLGQGQLQEWTEHCLTAFLKI